MKKQLLLIILIFTSILVWSQGISTEGEKIIDQYGNEVILRGMGFGGWMLQEGYMMQSSDVADTQHEFKDKLVSLMGETNTDEFYDSWLTNHVTRADIDSLAVWGFNSVRLPMHYNLFTLPIEDESIPGENTWLNKGFDLVDSLLFWCKSNNIYLILDLHAAPGGQGANAAISDYDPTKPSLWESPANRDKTVALWEKLAERYSDEPWIGGYDLLNEVNWTLPGNSLLRSLYIEITSAIRAVDSNHIIFIEGNSYANDFTGLTPPWDDNMVYSFHKYWNYNDPGSIGWVVNMRDQYNVPLWMGEGGENSNVWFHDAIKLFEDNDIGWSWWPMKRIETIVSPYSILFTDGYKDILKYWRNQGPKPSINEAYESMMELANNSNSLNCIHQKDVPDAMIRQTSTDETIPYNPHSIPGVVYMSDYDMGRLHFAYYDVDNVNYSASTGSFQAWNSGWYYRNDGVDIETNNDVTNSNGYHVGFVAKGEWMNYTVHIDESASYTAKVRVASQNNGGKFHLAIDGEDITSTQLVSATGSWLNFENQDITDVLLPKGEHILTLRFDGDLPFNLSSIEFVKTGTLDSVSFEALNGLTEEDEKSVSVVVNQPFIPESLSESIEYFSLFVNGTERPISSITKDESKERTITLSTDEYLIYTDIITVSYTGNLITTPTGKILEPFTELSIINTLPTRFILPKKIQAEDYIYMIGLGVEETTDVGGGSNIGYTNVGDYADYLIYSENETYYQLNLRLAAQNSEGKIGFYLVDENSDETELCTSITPLTGGWQTWTTVSSNLTIPKGVHKLRMRPLGGEFNLNWFQFEIVEYIKTEGLSSIAHVYPNPVKTNKLNVTLFYHNNISLPIEIYDLTGKLISSKIYHINNQSLEVDISNISKGMYILKVIAEGEVFSYKIIKTVK